MNQNVELIYGGGLSSRTNTKGKCPLKRDFKLKSDGDTCDNILPSDSF